VDTFIEQARRVTEDEKPILAQCGEAEYHPQSARRFRFRERNVVAV
jgi:hypothetical protein